MSKEVAEIVQKALKKLKISLDTEEIEQLITTPPSVEMGDYSLPCFSFSEKLKMPPNEVALNIRKKIGNIREVDFDDIQVEGGYLNFILDRKDMARRLVYEAITKKAKFGKTNIGSRRKFVVEFSSPNIAKPFGIGHLRSTIIGNSIANIAEFVGYKPVRLNYLGDWGTKFGKILFGYDKFGSETRLISNPIQHLLMIYTKANRYKKYEKPSREWFKKLESKDKKALMLWRLFKNLSLAEFEKIYKTLGVKFDDYSGEAYAIKGVPRVMAELKEKKLLKKSEGAMIVDLSQFNRGVAIIEKTDGTTTYIARDLATAIKRYEKYKFGMMVYQVGQEQTLYFNQLFKILELMGYKWAENCVHSTHGLYLDKDGKKFATRKGKTIFMQEILDKTTSLTKKEIKKRWPKLSNEEIERRALTVALSAIFYGDLKNNKKNNIVFNLDKFTSFDGDTGPYILYTYARASSILKKAEKKAINSKFEVKE